MTRRALVTGASRGIGAAVAADLAHDSEVIVTGRAETALRGVADRIGAHPIVCDHTDPDAAVALAADAGELDVLVAMAGGNTDFARQHDDSPAGVAAAWRANLEANVISTVVTVTALLPALRPGATIVTVSSIGAEYAGSSYGAAKAAVAAWTAGLSAQVGPRGITANCVAPGYIEGTAFFAGGLSDERRDALIAATHDKRAGSPGDIAGIVRFLASDGARHVTGQTLHVDGGAFTTR